LRMRRVGRRQRRERVAAVAAMLDLTALLNRKPAALSGGQRQRVAMGRAMVRDPACFLMDEPLSNLDARLRERIRGDLAQLLARLATTTLYVTHDQAEAMTLGERVAVVRAGRLEQVGAPEVLYRNPATCFVAAFLGTPGMNLIAATVASAGGRPAVRVGDPLLAVAGPAAATLATRPAATAVVAGIRPEAFTVSRGPQKEGTLHAEVVAVERLGHATVVRCHLAGADLVDPAHPDQADPTATLAARLAPDLPVAIGDPLPLAVAPAAILLFDPATGRTFGYGATATREA